MALRRRCQPATLRLQFESEWTEREREEQWTARVWDQGGESGAMAAELRLGFGRRERREWGVVLGFGRGGPERYLYAEGESYVSEWARGPRVHKIQRANRIVFWGAIFTVDRSALAQSPIQTQKSLCGADPTRPTPEPIQYILNSSF